MASSTYVLPLPILTRLPSPVRHNFELCICEASLPSCLLIFSVSFAIVDANGGEFDLVRVFCHELVCKDCHLSCFVFHISSMARIPPKVKRFEPTVTKLYKRPWRSPSSHYRYMLLPSYSTTGSPPPISHYRYIIIKLCLSVSRGHLGLLCPGLVVVSVCHRVNVCQGLLHLGPCPISVCHRVQIHHDHFINCLSLSDTCHSYVRVLGEGNRNGNKTSLSLLLSARTIIYVEKF